MDSREDKIAQLFKRPTDPLGLTDRPNLPGYIGTDELLEFLVPHLFGKDFPKDSLLPIPYSMNQHRFLLQALDTGKTLIACKTILDALHGSQLALLATDLQSKEESGTLHPFSTGDFGGLKAFEVKNDFLAGANLARPSPFPDWAKGKTFFLDAAEVEDWLGTVEPLAFLPPMVERDGNLLPERHITASEAICWVAGQEVVDWYGLIERGADLRDAISVLKAFRDGDDEPADYDDTAQSLCELLAERHTRSHAANEIIRQMQDNKLVGYGVLRQPEGHGIQGQFETIRENAFLVQRQFSTNEEFVDCLVAAFAGDNSEDRVARKQSAWTHVRFKRADLVKIWGAASDTKKLKQKKPGALDQSFSRMKNRTKPTKKEMAGKAYWRIFPGGHERQGLQWVHVEKQISDEINAQVSSDTIKRGLKEYRPDNNLQKD